MNFCPHFRGGLGCMQVGHFVVERTAAGGLRVLQAEPRVEITGQLIWEIENGNGHPDVSITQNPRAHHVAQHAGDVLTIRAENQTVVYRIEPQSAVARHFERDVWPAQWPD